MIRHRKNCLGIFFFITALLFLLNSCSSLPLIGKKKEEKVEKIPPGKTVTVEGMETIKGVNPPKSETPTSKKPSTPTTSSKKETETKVASIPTRPLYSPSLPSSKWGLRERWLF